MTVHSDEAIDGDVLGMAELASLGWKLLGALNRELKNAPPERIEAGEAMLRFAEGKLERTLAGSNMKLVTYDGESWSAQIPAQALNLIDIDDADASVESTIEPTILRGTRVILPGKILLRNL